MLTAVRSGPAISRARSELRARFSMSGLAQFTDYDALRLLLGFVMPKGRLEPAAMALIDKYGSFCGVLDAPYEELLENPQLDRGSATLIKLAKAIPEYYLLGRVKTPHNRECSHKELLTYLQSVLCCKKYEQFRVVFLDTHNKVICDEKLGEGTVDSHVVYPRTVMERAFYHNATGLIFAHNHPGGSPSPSHSDKEITRTLVEAARLLDIEVHDHFVIGKDAWFSFRDHGMI